ncbi:MAG: S41 family peptidase [bacterium]|nr:S41 family peptidase [bacterium]
MVRIHKKIFAAVVFVLLVCVGCAGTRQIPASGTGYEKQATAVTSGAFNARTKRFAIFEEVERHVLKLSYYFPEYETEKRKAFSACMEKHKIAKNDDPTHTAELSSVLNECNTEDKRDGYLSPRAQQEEEIDSGAFFDGVGISIELSQDKKEFRIRYVFPGSSLAGTPVREGDVIKSIRQQNETEFVSLEGKTVEDVVLLIRGPRGTKVSLEIWRGDERIGVFIAERKQIDPRIAIVKTLERGKVGYIKFGGFDYNMFRDKIAPAIESFTARGIRKIIFDVRGNPGGFMSEALILTAVFMDPNTLMLTVCKRDGCEKIMSLNRPAYFSDTAVVILVDKGSASASELVAGAVQFHKKAFIIGEKTYGKGSAQARKNLQNAPGSAVRITVAKFYFDSARTRTPENGGITPDLVVPRNDASGDVQLESALEHFRLMERNEHE